MIKFLVIVVATVVFAYFAYRAFGGVYDFSL